MKERPILFSAPMVRAILEGRKTMTRRAIKPQQMGMLRIAADVGECSRFMDNGYLHDNDLSYIKDFCPYGRIGDRLWVRETFAEALDGSFLYRADKMYDGMKRGDFSWKWKPSIFMPRKASRIILEITNIRVERLNDISEEDARAEGAGGERYSGQGFNHCIHREAFRTLWDSINDKRGYGFDANPWVWVVNFEKI